MSRDYDRVVAISRSGTTTEVVQALRLLPAGIPVTAVLGELGTPVGELATDIVDLSFADERSVVQTRFPTTLLTLLRTHLGLRRRELAASSRRRAGLPSRPTSRRPASWWCSAAAGRPPWRRRRR